MSILPIASFIIAVVGLPLLYYLRRRYAATGVEIRLSSEKIIVNQLSSSDSAKVAEAMAKETSSGTSLKDKIGEIREAVDAVKLQKLGHRRKNLKTRPTRRPLGMVKSMLVRTDIATPLRLYLMPPSPCR